MHILRCQQKTTLLPAQRLDAICSETLKGLREAIVASLYSENKNSE
jgi:hypothetical protein